MNMHQPSKIQTLSLIKLFKVKPGCFDVDPAIPFLLFTVRDQITAIKLPRSDYRDQITEIKSQRFYGFNNITRIIRMI